MELLTDDLHQFGVSGRIRCCTGERPLALVGGGGSISGNRLQEGIQQLDKARNTIRREEMDEMNKVAAERFVEVREVVEVEDELGMRQ